MKGYWSQTKLDGSPLAPGVVCWMQDYTEEGLGKVPTYGKSVDEVLDKLTRTNASAQQIIAAQKTPPAAAPTQTTAPVPKPAPRLSADQRMQATADLQNPATAADAVVKLFADATGTSPQAIVLQNFSRICLAWESAHPEFFRHPTNQKLVSQNAIMRAGSMKDMTAAHLDAAFLELQQGGYLVSETSNDEPIEQPTTQPSNPSEHPAETPATTPARPRMATTHRTGRIGSTQVPTLAWKPKWTREQIFAMSSAESRRLIESNDAEFNKACEYYWPSRAQRATA